MLENLSGLGDKLRAGESVTFGDVVALALFYAEQAGGDLTTLDAFAQGIFPRRAMPKVEAFIATAQEVGSFNPDDPIATQRVTLGSSQEVLHYPGGLAILENLSGVGHSIHLLNHQDYDGENMQRIRQALSDFGLPLG